MDPTGRIPDLIHRRILLLVNLGRRCASRSSTRRSRSAHTATGVLVGNASLLVVVGSRRHGARLGGVDAESKPSEKTVADAVTEKSVLHEGVNTIGLCLFAQNTIIFVEGEFLGVGSIRLESFDLRDEVLVKEGLSNMAGVVVSAEGLVGEESRVGMDHDVDMSSTAGVVTGEDGLELSNTIRVGLLNASKPSLVNVGLIRAIAIAVGNDTRVYASGVAVPHLQVDIGDRVAGFDVNNLVVEDDVETLLIFNDVLTNVFAGHIWIILANVPETKRERNSFTVRTLSNLGSQNTRVDAGKQDRRGSARAEALRSLVVRSVQGGISIALLQASLLASLVNLSRTTSDVASLDTTSSKLGGAVGEGGSLDRVEKLATFGGLVSNIMSWMGRGDASREGEAGEEALERGHVDDFNDSLYLVRERSGRG